MAPDILVRIPREARPENTYYTLPDFGNYPTEGMYKVLDKILPYAYRISAKTAELNNELKHISYDFDKCVQMAERHGIKEFMQ